jgi:NAD(P)-dependent dehydrogenase (short-subunit alcohol dehydrogenase family)
MRTERVRRRAVLGGALVTSAAAGLGGMSISQTSATERAEPSRHPDRKVALITGTSSGFGWLTSLTLARAGHHVFASMRYPRTTNAGPARELREFAKAERLALDVIDIDVRDDHSVEYGVAQVLRHAGRIDILVNNAGIYYPALVETQTMADIRDMFETNLFGHLRMNRAVLPTMREQREGLIVQITSGLGRLVLPFMASYAGPKFALEAMTEVTRYELSTFGVDVVIVEPARYNTDFIDPNGIAYYRRYLRRLAPEDARRREEYGELAERLTPFLQELPEAPDNQEVADAVASIVRMPSQERPVRLLTPGQDHLVELNDLTEQVMRQRMEAAGFGDLL